MKKLIASFIICFLFFSNIVNAAYIKAFPITVYQPDGTELQCFATGDEYYNWLHDENNYTIIQNDQGYYCYGILKEGKVVPSDHIVGRVNPSDIGISPGINISPEDMLAIRKSIVSKMPKKENNGVRVRHEGHMNNIVIYIRFADQSEYVTDTTYYWKMHNDTVSQQSMYSYYKEVSYNRLHIFSHFYPIPDSNIVISYQDSHPRQYFMPYHQTSAPEGYKNDSQRTIREHQLLKDAVEYVQDMIPESLDLDFNNDGLVDNISFVVKGAPTAWATLLWPHRWVLNSFDVFLHGKQVYDYNFQIETHLISTGASVLSHEMFHTLGAPDLYRYGNQTIDPIGPWDIMCANTTPAQSMSTYMKYKYGGWIDEIPEITKGGLYTLNTPWSETNNAYKIASPNSNSEFFIVEYRNHKHPYDVMLPGEGLLIYRCNPEIYGNADGPPDELYLYRPGGVNTVTNGNINQAYFSADVDRTEFNDYTNPPCFLNNNQPGGLYIRNISEPGDQISFEVILDILPDADFEVSDSIVTTNCAVDFSSESYFVVDSWLWEFEDGMPATSTERNPQGIVFNSEGEKTIKLTVTNSHGSNCKVKENYITVVDTIKPKPDFDILDNQICLNTTVELIDKSKSCPTSWKWSFSPNDVEFVDGTTENSQNPKIKLTSVADYDVTLEVSNGSGSNTITKEKLISTIGRKPEDVIGHFTAMSFESLGWRVENPDDDITWEIAIAPKENLTNRAAMINFKEYFAIDQHDYLYTPIIDLDKNYDLLFDHAYAMTFSSYSDTLVVSISTDCGDSWHTLARYAEDGSLNFATVPPTMSSFKPSGIDDWCGNDTTSCNRISLAEYEGIRTAMIRFEAIKISGNNLYIDNVRFELAQAIDDDDISNIYIYPNPSDNGIFYSNLGNYNANVRVFDITGKQVFYNENMTGQDAVLDISNLRSGMYFVNILSDKIQKTIKVIKK